MCRSFGCFLAVVSINIGLSVWFVSVNFLLYNMTLQKYPLAVLYQFGNSAKKVG